MKYWCDTNKADYSVVKLLKVEAREHLIFGLINPTSEHYLSTINTKVVNLYPWLTSHQNNFF
jgi:hypothetical protein